MTNPQPELKRNYILVALMMTMFLAAMDIAVISTVIPEIVGDIGGFKIFSWVFSIYLLTQTATIPLYGKLADLYGRKKILLFGISVFLIGSAASGAAWDIYALIAFRGVQGIGGGAIMSIAATIAGDIYTIEERAKIQGWLSSVWGVSGLLGPVIGGSLAEYISWRWIFFINIPLGIIAMILIAVHLKEKITKQKAYIDYWGALSISALLVTLIVFLLNGGQTWPWFSVQSLVLLILVIILIFVSIWVERHAKAPILPKWVLTNRTFLGSNLAVVGLGITMMGPQVYFPTFMQASLGFSIILSGLVLTAMSIGWPLSSSLSGKLYLRIGFRNTELIGVCLVILSAAGFLLIPWPQPIHWLVINLICLGAGFGLISTPTMVGVQSVVDWDKRGVVTGTNQFSRYLGQSLGAAIFGAIFNATYAKELDKTDLAVSKNMENVLEELKNPELSSTAKEVIQLALNTATQHVFYAMVIFSILTFIAIYLLVPKKLKKFDDRNTR